MQKVPDSIPGVSKYGCGRLLAWNPGEAATSQCRRYGARLTTGSDSAWMSFSLIAQVTYADSTGMTSTGDCRIFQSKSLSYVPAEIWFLTAAHFFALLSFRVFCLFPPRHTHLSTGFVCVIDGKGLLKWHLPPGWETPMATEVAFKSYYMHTPLHYCQKRKSRRLWLTAEYSFKIQLQFQRQAHDHSNGIWEVLKINQLGGLLNDFPACCSKHNALC